MAEYLIQDESLKLLANVIREKSGKIEDMDIYDMAARVCQFETDTDIGTPTRGVIFYDYDGTILYTYTIEEARALTALPELPTHEGVTSSEWTHTLEEVNSNVSFLQVGALYECDKIIITIETTQNNFSLPLNFYQTVANGVSVNWGDGSNAQTFSSLNVDTSHTYTTAGEYKISFELLSGEMKMPDGKYLLNDTYPGNEDAMNTSLIKHIIYGFDVGTVNNNNSAGMFSCAQNLKSIIICNGVTRLNSNMFYHCYSLKCAIFPRTLQYIYNIFNEPRDLETIIIPNVNIISPSVGGFLRTNSYSSNTERIVLPDNFETNGVYAYVLFPASLKEIYFKSKIPINITTTSFDGLANDYKIYVPIEALDVYKTADVWSQFVDHMVGIVYDIPKK